MRTGNNMSTLVLNKPSNVVHYDISAYNNDFLIAEKLFFYQMFTIVVNLSRFFINPFVHSCGT